MAGLITGIMNPAVYHGHGRKAPFFEGWYYKLVSANGKERVAVIPAVFLGKQGHAFIQVLDGVQGRMDYHSFPLQQFDAAREEFRVRIAENTFSMEGFSLDLDSPVGRASGEVHIHNPQPWPVSVLSPGVMGWYAWVPAMECYHGVLSFDHEISGKLAINGREIDFNGGRGYMEKDWGASFPQGYIWMQSNHFAQVGVSLMASVAVIPWRGSAFPGFIIGLWHNGVLWRFASYTGARIEQLDISEKTVRIAVRDRRNRLELQVDRAGGVSLRGPTKTDMGMRVDESLAGQVHANLMTMQGEILFEGSGHHAGLEVTQAEKLLAWIRPTGA